MFLKVNTQLRRSSRCLHTTSPIESLQQKQLRRPAPIPRNKVINRPPKLSVYEGQAEQEIPIREPPKRSAYRKVLPLQSSNTMPYS